MVVTLWGKKFWSAHTILVHIHIFIACVFELPRSMLKNLFKYPASVWREIEGQTSTFFYSHFTSNATHPQHPSSMLVQPMNLNVLKVFKCWKSRVKHLLGGLFKFHFYICWCRSGGFCCYSCHSLGFIDNHNRLLLIYTCNIMHCTLGTCVSQLSHFHDFAISRKKMQIILHYFHFCRLFTFSFSSFLRSSFTLSEIIIISFRIFPIPPRKGAHFYGISWIREKWFSISCEVARGWERKQWWEIKKREHCSGNVPKYSWLVKFSSKLFSLVLCLNPKRMEKQQSSQTQFSSVFLALIWSAKQKTKKIK